MPQNPLVGGVTLRRPAIASPNFVTGVSGWSINADGSAEFDNLAIRGTFSGTDFVLNSSGLFFYSTGTHSLILSLATAAGVDPYGNAYPAGLYANQATSSGMAHNNPTITGGQLANSILSGPMVTAPTVSGGTVSQTVITFNSAGGALFAYATTTTVSTITSGTSWTSPAGSYTAGKVECWGPAAGADGGTTSAGGMSNGSGAYAQEPSYPLTPSTAYAISIGLGGQAGTTGNPGQSGTGPTTFDNGGVAANPGLAGVSPTPGLGGTAGSNTIARAGTAGTAASGGTGGSGGPGSPGASGAGGAGAAGSGSSGGAGGTAGAGGGQAGAAGGNNAANGSAGTLPGSAGGGPGAGSAGTQGSKQYFMTGSASYYGSDATNGNPNGQRNSTPSNGTMFQGGETASGGSANGVQKSLMLLPSTVASDLSGVTIDSVTLRLEWLHTWYNSGGDIALGYNGRTSLPSTWTASDITSVATWFQGSVGSPVTTDLSSTGLGAALKSGAATALTIGPGPGNISNPNLNYYGYAYGADTSANSPLLTVNYHTGSAPTVGGNGANGQIKVTTVNTSAIALSISPVSGTDSFGNSYPAGLAAIQAGTDYASLDPNGSNAALGFGASGGGVDASLWRVSAGLIGATALQVAQGSTDYVEAYGNGSNAALGFGAHGGAVDASITRQAAGVLDVGASLVTYQS
jgi:collagen type I alpha